MAATLRTDVILDLPSKPPKPTPILEQCTFIESSGGIQLATFPSLWLKTTHGVTAEALDNLYYRYGRSAMDQCVQRWTANRKAELVVAILKKENTLTDARPENDLKQAEVNRWIAQFRDSGKRNLQVKSKDQMVEHRKEIESLQRKIGELVLQNDILKKHQVCRQCTRRRSIDRAG